MVMWTGSGEIDATDSWLIGCWIEKTPMENDPEMPDEETMKIAADVNHDGKIDLDDVDFIDAFLENGENIPDQNWYPQNPDDIVIVYAEE